MPTKFKRYHCVFCNRTVVVWKMRVFYGKRMCPQCVQELYEGLTETGYLPRSKWEVLSQVKLVKCNKQGEKDE